MNSKNIEKKSKKSSYKLSSALKFRIGDAGDLRASVSASAGEFNLSPEIVHLLCLIQQEVPLHSLAARLKQDFRQISGELPPQSEIEDLVYEMADAGCLVGTSSEPRKTGGLQDGFGDPWIQWAMLADKPRCQAYQKAISSTVGTNSVVVDVGAGTGLLSLYAHISGARKIHCIEETASVNILARVRNSLPERERGRIKIYNRNSADVELPRDVTHIVSELFGNDPLQEGIISTLRDIFSRAGTGRTIGIPESFEVVAQLADVRKGPLKLRLERLNSDENSDTDDWWTPVRTIRSLMNFEDVSFAHPIRESDIRFSGDLHPCFKVPLSPPPAAHEPTPVATFKHKFNEPADCPVLLLCFRAQLNSKISISNIPGEKDECEHWSPIVVPLRKKTGQNETLCLRVGVSGNWERISADICNSKNQVIGSRR
jgi:hypothetical protein